MIEICRDREKNEEEGFPSSSHQWKCPGL